MAIKRDKESYKCLKDIQSQDESGAKLRFSGMIIKEEELR
jgi:hypothetical protein